MLSGNLFSFKNNKKEKEKKKEPGLKGFSIVPIKEQSFLFGQYLGAVFNE